MPDKSQAQERAMYAAKEGHSTLGIPRKVGADYIAADKAAGNPKLPKRVGKMRGGVIAPSRPGGFRNAAMKSRCNGGMV